MSATECVMESKRHPTDGTEKQTPDLPPRICEVKMCIRERDDKLRFSGNMIDYGDAISFIFAQEVLNVPMPNDISAACREARALYTHESLPRAVFSWLQFHFSAVGPCSGKERVFKRFSYASCMCRFPNIAKCDWSWMGALWQMLGKIDASKLTADDALAAAALIRYSTGRVLLPKPEVEGLFPEHGIQCGGLASLPRCMAYSSEPGSISRKLVSTIAAPNPWLVLLAYLLEHQELAIAIDPSSSDATIIIHS